MRKNLKEELAKVQAPQVEEKVQIEPINYPEMALSTYRNPEGKWVLVKIEYNPILKVAGSVTFVGTPTDSKQLVIEQFKVAAAKLDLV